MIQVFTKSFLSPPPHLYSRLLYPEDNKLVTLNCRIVERRQICVKKGFAPGITERQWKNLNEDQQFNKLTYVLY